MDAMTDYTPSRDSDSLLARAKDLLQEMEGPEASVRPSVANILRELCDRVRALERAGADLAEHIALEHRTHQDFRDSIDELIRVQELSGAISGSLNLDSILTSLASLAREVVPYEDFGVFQIQHEDEPPSPLTIHSKSGTLADRLRRLWEDKVIDWAIQQGHPTVVPDAQAGAEEGEAVRESSLVVVPMRGRGGCTGVFALSCNKPQDAFTAGELDLIGFLSQQAAIALENARLYRSLEDTNRRLRESQSQLVHAGKLAAVGQLAGGVAHEVNNPLQIILSRVQLLMIRHREIPRLLDDLKLIESNVRRISRIIRSLLDFARYNSGEMESANVDVAHLARQTCTLIQHQLEKADIALIIDAPPDLPRVYGNAGEIEQVFLNLLLNAQYAMPSGGRIEIGMRAEPQRLIVSVSDTGVGIPEDVLPKIFEPFFTTRGAEGGSGLGLSIIHGIMEKHRGRIEVESQEGVGTTFTLSFPAAAGGPR